MPSWRAVAALPQGHQDYFDGLVADERAKAADAERIAKVRAMSDEDAVQFAIKQASEFFGLGGLPERLLAALREAGFGRLTGPDMNAADENRSETGLRNIVTILRGPRVEFEISDIVEEVRVLAKGHRPDLRAAYRLGFASSNNAFNGQTSHPAGERFRNKMDLDLRVLESSR
ncbi:protein of unknown function [Methylorubrum extorquens DM4]|uniref:Uncharacterized protein n=1 Tax=Methylorubrum extorquens (strain DSM 6343 / CIP 106787 / DM4) TaxID=661410 RepID=C7C7W7_METED|nr:hypothetical protein [Methylorubrum extorquens]CAX21896.1 protein of unknown function [Methylorubrum extorquens DM4]